MSGFKMNDFTSAFVEQESKSKDSIILSGSYKVELYDKDGNFIEKREGKNAIVNVGLDYCLNTTFNNLANINPFFIALIDNSPSPAVNNTDTMGSHSGWNEFVGYSETLRQDWTEGAASSQSITNAVSADFTITSGATLWGIFLTSDNDKGGGTGTLWSTAQFAGTLTVVATNVVKITYTVNAA